MHRPLPDPTNPHPDRPEDALTRSSWRLSEHLWERWMERARQSFADRDTVTAGNLWRAAHEVAATFDPADPRRAATLDALATAAVGDGAVDHAKALYGQAIAAWAAAAAWVAVMATAQAARSSTFHLRLELKHRGAYPEITRARHAKTAGAGRAGSEANLAALNNDLEGLRHAMTARRDAFGNRESGAFAMASRLGESVEARVMDRWVERPPSRYDDERRLYAAALLAPVLQQYPLA